MALRPDDLFGRIMDCDSHEMIATPQLGEHFGEAGQRLAEQIPIFLSIIQKDAYTADAEVRDSMAITPEICWTVKGAAAPSAMDFARRIPVMDTMGLQRQLIFPTTAFLAYLMYVGLNFEGYLTGQPYEKDFSRRDPIARPLIREYNNWVIRNTKDLGTDRARFVALLLVESVEQMMADAEELLTAGVKAVVLPPGEPPAGLSPAHPDLDPFWSLFAEAKVPLTLHIGNEMMFFDPSWTASPTLLPDLAIASPEAPTLSPHYLANVCLPSQNYVVNMVMGGVFERHPELRFGITEVTAGWVPSTAARMDLCNYALTKSERGQLAMKPSEYVARNIRVAPFHFEPVDRIFEEKPELASVYVYGSDYPHIEGGKNSFQRMYDMVAPLGDDIVEKFFVTNGEWLLPE